jgi:AcrR family transcriptional regulator
VSADERRAERRSNLKEACLDLIGEAGVVPITAEGVSGRAGLTKRYFYESFSDRDALLYEVMDEFFTDARTAMLDARASDEGTPSAYDRPASDRVPRAGPSPCPAIHRIGRTTHAAGPT